MNRFNFRLERVLKVKRQRERQAELSQRQAQSRVEAARMQLRLTQQRMNREASTVAAHLGQPRTAASRITAMMYLNELQRLVDLAQSHVAIAEKRLNEASAERAKIHREVESLQILRHGQWQEHKRFAARATQEQLDDWSMRRWQSSQSDDEFKSISAKEVMGR